jgi:hypothetical protein
VAGVFGAAEEAEDIKGHFCLRPAGRDHGSGEIGNAPLLLTVCGCSGAGAVAGRAWWVD